MVFKLYSWLLNHTVPLCSLTAKVGNRGQAAKLELVVIVTVKCATEKPIAEIGPSAHSVL